MKALGSETTNEAERETTFHLRAVSRGIAIGKAVVLHGLRAHFRKVRISKRQIGPELKTFEVALKAAGDQLRRLTHRSSDGDPSSRHGVFEAQLLMLTDATFSSDVAALIKGELLSAQWAVRKVADSLSALFRRADDDHFREKALDVEDVAERVLIALGATTALKLRRDSVIVATEIGPSIIAELGRSGSRAIVAEKGGWTSHGFILARELGVPAATGLTGAVRRIHNGDTVIVDGFLGKVILNPRTETLRHYRLLSLDGARTAPSKRRKPGPLKTLDGEEITLRANVDALSGFAVSKSKGAKGIGLFRSELLISSDGAFPSETEQIEVYTKLGKAAGRYGARIRTFDTQIDRLLVPASVREANPALGLRAVRLMMEYPLEFRKQLRALLTASSAENIHVILPMVSDLGEIAYVKSILKSERAKLVKRGIKAELPPLGAMVEVPAAVTMSDIIAEEVDFLCIGTNDLVQYTLAVDRDNQDVADHYRSVHPAVLRSIKTVVEAGRRNGKTVIVCGEMAASPVYAAILVGLGVRELSMNPASLERVGFTLSGIAREECEMVATKLLSCRGVEDAEQQLSDALSTIWAEMTPLPSAGLRAAARRN